MKIAELVNQAVGVQTIGVVELQENDSVLVGVQCVFKDGKFIPVTKTFKLTPEMFDVCDVGEVIPIKRIK